MSLVDQIPSVRWPKVDRLACPPYLSSAAPMPTPPISDHGSPPSSIPSIILDPAPTPEPVQPGLAAAVVSVLDRQRPSEQAEDDEPDDVKPKPKRMRESRPKVKTGCHQCRQRRVKCDEARPACTRCSKARRECSGYPARKRFVRPLALAAIAPKPVAMALFPSPMRAVLPMSLPLPAYLLRPQPGRFATAPSSVTLYRPSDAPPLRRVESPYFRLFHTTVAGELSGYFDSDFWSRIVLQACHTEPAVRHATVALGALYTALERAFPAARPPASTTTTAADAATGGRKRRRGATGGSLPTGGDPWAHWHVAVTQYSHACQALVRLGTVDRPESQRVRLMTGVLMACFDSFLGHHSQAILQIQNALRLLDQLRIGLPPGREPVEAELVCMINGLALQAKSYDMAFHFPAPYVVRFSSPLPPSPPPSVGALSPDPCDSLPSSPSSVCPSSTSWSSSLPSSLPSSTPAPLLLPLVAPLQIPAVFTSLETARRMWDRLLESIFRFTEALADFAYAHKGPALRLLPPQLRDRSAGFGAQIDAWIRAFDPLLVARVDPAAALSQAERTAIAVVKMTQITGHILFRMIFSHSELHFDHFLHEFRFVVHLADEVIRAGSAPPTSASGLHEAPPAVRPSFSADMGIVPPLYVVATKCRDSAVRRRAIRLLRHCARREAMWDSELTARIGDWIADIEEDGDNTVLGPSAAVYGPAPPIPAPAGLITLPSIRHVPEDRRVTVQSVHFDLRSRQANLIVGSRAALLHGVDQRSRETSFRW